MPAPAVPKLWLWPPSGVAAPAIAARCLFTQLGVGDDALARGSYFESATIFACETFRALSPSPAPLEPVVELSSTPRDGFAAITLAHPLSTGRAEAGDACPLLGRDFVPAPGQPAHVRLGAASLVVARGRGEDRGPPRALLTRRGPWMRTFPRAWVCPGGGVDAGETPAAAAARELREETALATSGGSALAGIWESVFPTNAEAVAVGGGEVKAHFALLFYTAEVETLPAPPQSAAPWPPRPTLQPEECDAAVWVTPGDLEVGGIRGYDAKGEPIEIEAAQIAGIYPNSIGEGIAQGNRWALETLAGS